RGEWGVGRHLGITDQSELRRQDPREHPAPDCSCPPGGRWLQPSARFQEGPAVLVFANTALAAQPWLPALVFVAELCVVTLSTVRIICLGRGQKVLASAIGFFEVSIWLFAIGQIMKNLSDVGCYLGFAGGFTVGNFLGVLVEKRLGLGTLVVR